MDDRLQEQLEKLSQVVGELEKASREALGFVGTIEFRGVSFHVSRRFVIADLSPLAFFHLVEHIDTDARTAVVNLYERLVPLLECEHQWAPLQRADDEGLRKMGDIGFHGDSRPMVCRVCTAYALGHSLPRIGRDLPKDENG